ncbi:hypothetical protein J8402_16540 [Chromohalobacter israelensis]|uniref:hypothetical protein n=1 Tax=Chromohalobacter israelensis TaxID=141390 RepID=UPI003AF5C754
MGAAIARVLSDNGMDVLVQSSVVPSFGQLGQPDGEKRRHGGKRPPKMALEVESPPAMTHPVSPPPYFAVYVGKGDYMKAASWARAETTQVVKLCEWSGQNLFGAYPLSGQ